MPLSVIHDASIFSTLWFAFLLINGDKLFFFWWIEVANFQESNVSIFSFTLEHYVAWLKYSLILGHEDVCLNYLLKLKKELTFG